MGRRFIVTEVIDSPSSSGAGCGGLIVLFLIGSMLYAAYQWFISILPMLMLIGGCIIGLVVFVALVKSIGIGKTLLIALIGGGAFGTYRYIAEGAAEEQRIEDAEVAAIAEKADAEATSRVLAVETARSDELRTELSQYFSPPEQSVEGAPLLSDIYKSFSLERSRRPKSTPMTVTSKRIDGLVDESITELQFYKRPGLFTFTGRMKKYSGEHSCYGSVEYGRPAHHIIFSAFCLGPDNKSVESATRYASVKAAQKRKALKNLFAAEEKTPEWMGLWKASDEPCTKKSKGRGYGYVGRTLLSANGHGSKLDLFGLTAAEQGGSMTFKGWSERYSELVTCSGSLEPVGKVKQASFQCTSSFVDSDSPQTDGSYVVSKRDYEEQVFYLCTPRKRFP